MARIARVDIGRVDYPLVGEFKFFRTQSRPTIMLRLTDENGVEGWGQSVPIETWTYETVESVETTLRHYLAPAILGADPSDIADIHARMERAIRPSFSVGQPLCKAAIDLACYDLWGKQTRRSGRHILGGAKKSDVKAELDGANTDHRRRARAARALAHSLGYTNFNIKIGYPQTPGLRSGAGADGHDFRARRFSLGRRQYKLRARDRTGDGTEARRSRPEGD